MVVGVNTGYLYEQVAEASCDWHFVLQMHWQKFEQFVTHVSCSFGLLLSWDL